MSMTNIINTTEGSKGDVREPRVIFRFERGSYFDGDLFYKIMEEEDGFWFYGEGTNRFDLMAMYRFQISEEDLDQLAKYVLPAKEWPEENRAVGVMDGYYWIIHFDHKGLEVHTSGYMKFPEGYKIVVGNLQMFIENLCLTYAPDEYDYGWERRVEF